MTSFWDKKLNTGTQPPPVPQRYQTQFSPVQESAASNNPAWWMAAPPTPTGPSIESYVPGRDGPAIEELARMDVSTLSQEALELVAAYKLKNNKKYDNRCPHCDAENGLIKASRSVAPRCVECGYSERAVHDQLQPLTQLRPRTDTLHARDFTGGNVGRDMAFQHRSESPYISEQGGPGR